MYITIDNQNQVTAIYENGKLPETVKENAIYLEGGLPEKPAMQKNTFHVLKYDPEQKLYWEAVIRKTYLSKLSIRRELRAIGLENLLDAYLENNPVYKKDWLDADAMELTDSAFVDAWEVLKNQLPDPEEFLNKVRS